jgi:hypothetical protein
MKLNRIGLMSSLVSLHFFSLLVSIYNYDACSVPEQCSEMFRTTIESLFITHAETRLNTFGNVLRKVPWNEDNLSNNPWSNRGDEWCPSLVRRPKPKNPAVPSTTTASLDMNVQFR